MSVDPDLAETGQPYAFTGDDPLNKADPLGLEVQDSDGGGGGSEILGYGSGGGIGGGDLYGVGTTPGADGQPIEQDIPDSEIDLHALASDVANELGGDVQSSKTGYKVNVPVGAKVVQIRVEPESAVTGKPYYRISTPNKGSYTIYGEMSSARELTHLRVTKSSLKDIIRIVTKIRRGR